MNVDPLIAAAITACGVLGAATITALVATRSSRRAMRTEVAKAQDAERVEVHAFMSEQFKQVREETDSLRKRVRSTEVELSDCVKQHLKAELALMRAGIPLDHPPNS